MTESYWRRRAAPIVAQILRETKGQSEEKIRKALREAYPFGERRYHPYKIWLDEIQRQRGKKHPLGHKRSWENRQDRISRDQKKWDWWTRRYGIGG